MNYPKDTTHKYTRPTRYGNTYSWYKVDLENKVILEWYTPFREFEARWAEHLDSFYEPGSEESFNKFMSQLTLVDEEVPYEPKPHHTYIGTSGQKAYDRPENPYYPDSKGGE